MTDPARTPLPVVRLDFYDSQLLIPEAFRAEHTVICVTVEGTVMTGGGRLLAEREPNRLLAFDADPISAGLTHGDGKTNRYDVGGFVRQDQRLIWHIRTQRGMDVRVEVHYILKHATDGGTYRISCGKSAVEKTVEGTDATPQTILTDVLHLHIPAGRSDLEFAPVTLCGGFMHILDVVLIPERRTERASGPCNERGSDDLGGEVRFV